MAHSLRIELTRAGLLVYLANYYTNRDAHECESEHNSSIEVPSHLLRCHIQAGLTNTRTKKKKLDRNYKKQQKKNTKKQTKKNQTNKKKKQQKTPGSCIPQNSSRTANF